MSDMSLAISAVFPRDAHHVSRVSRSPAVPEWFSRSLLAPIIYGSSSRNGGVARDKRDSRDV